MLALTPVQVAERFEDIRIVWLPRRVMRARGRQVAA